MAVLTLQPTVNQTPDPALVGDLAVTTPSNTGHASTVTSVSVNAQPPGGADNDTRNRSCIWHSFSNVSGQIKSINLKFDWSVDQTASANQGDAGASAFAQIVFIGEYSTNNGTSYTTAIAQTTSAVGNQTNNPPLATGSVNVSLSVATNITQIRVRVQEDGDASCDAGGVVQSTATANEAVIISNIQLVVETLDIANLLVMM